MGDIIDMYHLLFINNRVVVPDIMEARNMVTAREMVHDGNWLVPTMNGDLRLEKPPLPTWLTAVAEMISPDNRLFSVRWQVLQPSCWLPSSTSRLCK